MSRAEQLATEWMCNAMNPTSDAFVAFQAGYRQALKDAAEIAEEYRPNVYAQSIAKDILALNSETEGSER